MGKVTQNVNTGFPMNRVGPVPHSAAQGSVRYLGRIIAGEDHDGVPAPASWENQEPRDITRYLVALCDERTGKPVGCAQSKEYNRRITANSHIAREWKAIKGRTMTTADDTLELVGEAVAVTVEVRQSQRSGNEYANITSMSAAGALEADAIPSIGDLKDWVKAREAQLTQPADAAPAQAPKTEASAPVDETPASAPVEEAPAAEATARDW